MNHAPRPGRAAHAGTVGAAAISLVALVLALVAVPATDETPWEFALAFATFAAAFVVVGALVVVRRPGHPVGRLMLAVGVLLSAPVLAGQYAGHVLFGSGEGPAPLAAAWLTSWLYIVALGLVIQLLLVFPDGRYGRRRWVALVAGTATVVGAGAQAVLPGAMDGFGAVVNPLGIEAARDELGLVVEVTGAVYGLCFVAAVAVLLLRLRGARGAERQQLKWFASAATFFLLAQLVNVLPIGFGDDSWIGLIGVVVGLLAIPSAIGLAVLRYRLYDIDVVINRTLVYGALTAMLVAAYLGSVLVFRLVLSPVTGESQLAVAGSTLAVAALFRPLRSRIQSVVDRRFYRSRYDATRTLEGFGARLRDELDLDALGTDLRTVVTDTMAPAHVSLWLRKAPS